MVAIMNMLRRAGALRPQHHMLPTADPGATFNTPQPAAKRPSEISGLMAKIARSRPKRPDAALNPTGRRTAESDPFLRRLDSEAFQKSGTTPGKFSAFTRSRSS